MILPAAVYAAVTWPDALVLRGWAIPAATDIVLALAVLSLAGGRVVQVQRVFLTALAVLDDVGGILIIATFYAESLVVPLLALAGVAAAALVMLNRRKVQRVAAFGVAGAVRWLTLIDSGVNATLTGVIIGAAIPLRTTEGVGRR